MIAPTIIIAMHGEAALAGAADDTDSDHRAVVLPLAIEGTLPPRGAETLAKRVDQGLARSGVGLERATTTCSDAECYRGLAEQHGASHVVRPRVERVGDDYVLAVELLDGSTGTVLATAEDTCDLCGLAEAADMAQDLGARVGTKLGAASLQPRLVIDTVPPGAIVSLDGRALGTTPLETVVDAGAHELEVAKEGFITQRRSTQFVGGVRETMHIELQPAPSSSVDGRGRALRIAGWTGIGLGLGSIGAGIALVLINETPVRSRCSGPDIDIEGNCRLQHETLPGGIVMSAAGVAGVVAGAVLVALNRPERRLQATHNGLIWRF